MLFIKIALSLTSLIPCLILPTDDRENSEGTPTQLPVTQKCFFVKICLYFYLCSRTAQITTAQWCSYQLHKLIMFNLAKQSHLYWYLTRECHSRLQIPGPRWKMRKSDVLDFEGVEIVAKNFPNTRATAFL